MKNLITLVALILAPALAGAVESGPRIQGRSGVPPVHILKSESGKLGYVIKIQPGAATPGETVFIALSLEEVLETPHPRFGTRRPIDDADVTAVLTSGSKNKKRKWLEARTGAKLRDAGAYGFSFTIPKNAKGVFTLHLTGSVPNVGPIKHAVPVGVGVWPVPADSKLAAMPSKYPAATLGDRAHGRALCVKMCKKLPGIIFKDDAPIFVPSAIAASLSDDAFLSKITGGKSQSLSMMDRTDLLFYLRDLHMTVRAFFPEAAVYMAKKFTINEHGQERLKDTANITLDGSTASGTVFIVYKGDKKGSPTLIDFDNRVARDRLETSNKIGYLLFLEIPGEKRAKEIGIAMAKEPEYSIKAIRARASNGRVDSAFNRQLQSFVGKGKFNDARSLSGGSKSYQKKILPLYLRAAELATMYYADEREFTAFDAEFGDL